MNTPFEVVAGCEAKNVEPGRSTLWASVTIAPRGKAFEAVRAPLAVVLVLDVSGSMKGDPIMHVRRAASSWPISSVSTTNSRSSRSRR